VFMQAAAVTPTFGPTGLIMWIEKSVAHTERVHYFSDQRVRFGIHLFAPLDRRIPHGQNDGYYTGEHQESHSIGVASSFLPSERQNESH